MYKILGYLFLVPLVACTSLNKVRVLDAQDVGECQVIATYSTLQCVTGAASVRANDKATAVLKRLAVEQGADTVVCCSRPDQDEEIVLAGYNPSTGRIVCVGLGYLSGSIYQCGNSLRQKP